MAGFMAGFGKAFSSSFSQASSQAAQKEQDEFRLGFQHYTDTVKERQKADAETKKLVQGAKSIVGATGQPPEAWTEAYKMLQGGMPETLVYKHFEENKASIEPISKAGLDNSGPAAPNQSLTSQASSSVDAQMQQTGMTPPPDKGIFGNIRQSMQDRSQNRMHQRIAGAANTTPEDVSQTFKNPQPTSDPLMGNENYAIKWQKKSQGFDPTKINTLEEATVANTLARRSNDPVQIKLTEDIQKSLENVAVLKAEMAPDAKAKAEGVYSPTRTAAVFDEQNKFVKIAPVEEVINNVNGTKQLINAVTKEPLNGRPVYLNKEVMDDYKTIAKDIEKPRADYLSKVNGYIDGVGLAGEMSDIVAGDPRVLTVTANVAESLQGYVREAYSAMTLIEQEAKQGNFNDSGLKKLEEIEQQIQGALGSGVNDLAGKRALLEAKVNLAAYRFAMMEGQEGRGLSNQDFERFRQLLLNSKDPAIFQQNVAGYLNNKKKALKAEGQTLSTQNETIKRFENSRGFNPFSPVLDVDQYLKESTDPSVAKGLEFTTRKQEEKSIFDRKKTETEAPGWLSKTTISPVEYQYMDERTRVLLQKKYGGID